jgi:hypothetical protein
MDLPKNELDQVDLDSQTVCDSKDDEANMPVIKCNGEVCSNHGIQFDVCVTECIPVTDVSLLAVAKECVFATKPVRDMTPKEKRFLLYYWYAQQVCINLEGRATESTCLTALFGSFVHFI